MRQVLRKYKNVENYTDKYFAFQEQIPNATLNAQTHNFCCQNSIFADFQLVCSGCGGILGLQHFIKV